MIEIHFKVSQGMSRRALGGITDQVIDFLGHPVSEHVREIAWLGSHIRLWLAPHKKVPKNGGWLTRSGGERLP